MNHESKVFSVEDDNRDGLLLLAHASKNLRAKHGNMDATLGYPLNCVKSRLFRVRMQLRTATEITEGTETRAKQDAISTPLIP